ncbi:hypothetical protein JCM8097_004767 [Rhodosporidiobolus ruineniae]
MASNYSNWHVGVVDSDDDDEVEDDYRYTKQATLWAIEATDAMLAPTLDDDAPPPTAPDPTPTPTATQRPSQSAAVAWKGKPARSKMEVCLRAAYSIMKRKVVSSPKDLVGILIWNTNESKGGESFDVDYAHLLLDLKQVDAQSIRMMKELLERAEEDPEYLRTLLKPNTQGNIVAEMFGACSTIFRTRCPNASNTVFLVTDNDDPLRGTPELLQVAKTKRSDLHDMGYAIEPFLIPERDNADFDVDNFWGEIITAVDEDEGAAVNYPIVNRELSKSLQGMIDAMRTKEAAKRVAFKIPFVLGQGLVIGVAGYNLVGEERKKLPTKVDLNTAAGEEVVSKTVYKDGETGDELNLRNDVKKFFQVGTTDYEKGIQASKIFFSDDDLRKVKSLGRPPSLKLLGFVPREGYLKFHETVKHSHFIYPDEDRYSGSTRTFAALLKSMLKKEVVAYASFIARTSSKPQVVILVPQAEELNSAGVAVTPPGIHICQLPFADDVRDLNLDSTVSVLVSPTDEEEDPEQPAVDIAKKIIGKLVKKYQPDAYPNPALNYFYETLAAVALDEDIPEPDDKTVPAYENIHERVGKYTSKLKALIPEGEMDASRVKTSSSKRPVKKEEKEDGPPPDLSEFVEQFQEKGMKMTVPQIKAGLKAMGEKMSGNKGELYERAQDYLREHGLIKPEPKDGMDLDDDEEEDVKPAVKKKKRKVVRDEEDEDDY